VVTPAVASRETEMATATATVATPAMVNQDSPAMAMELVMVPETALELAMAMVTAQVTATVTAAVTALHPISTLDQM